MRNLTTFLLINLAILLIIIQKNSLFREIILFDIGIPRLIHFIWIDKHLNGSVGIPHYDRNNIEEWKAMNPDFEIIIWNTELVNERFPEVAKILKTLPSVAWVSDLLRYKIMYEYGGLYIDTDIRPIKPVHELLQRYKKSGFLVCERPRTNVVDMTEQCKYICNAVMFSKPKNIVMLAMFDDGISKTRKAILDFSTNKTSSLTYKAKIYGPGLVTGILKRNQYATVTILGSVTFFPCDWTARSKCIYEHFKDQSNTYAMHEWKKRW